MGPRLLVNYSVHFRSSIVFSTLQSPGSLFQKKEKERKENGTAQIYRCVDWPAHLLAVCSWKAALLRDVYGIFFP